MTAVATGATLIATLNGKTVPYVCVVGDTTATAAANWATLLGNQSTAPPEFSEIVWTVTNNVVTATALVPGVPFAGMTNGLVFSASGGALVSTATLAAGSSPSDVLNPNNWSRLGLPSLPLPADDLVLANSQVPLLWNLDQLAGTPVNSLTRWQSFGASVGLPETNPNGYQEYRPTYLVLSSTQLSLPILLGQGQVGQGPSRERYDTGTTRTTLTVLASGSPADDYAVRWRGSHPLNTLNVVNTSVGVATTPTEVASLLTATADGGAVLDLGPGATISGSLTYLAAQGTLTMAGQPAAPSPLLGSSSASPQGPCTVACYQLTLSGISSGLDNCTGFNGTYLMNASGAGAWVGTNGNGVTATMTQSGSDMRLFVGNAIEWRSTSWSCSGGNLALVANGCTGTPAVVTVTPCGASSGQPSPAAGGPGAAPAALNVLSGSSVVQMGNGLTWPQINVLDGSTLSWRATGTLTSLNLARNSALDCTSNLQPLTVVGCTLDTSSTVLDPNSSIAFANPVVINGPVTAGPIQLGPNRRLQPF